MRRIVSGGQTGVDRGALDAALAAGFPAGGWCPQGRLAEDGPIDPRYPLDELSGAGYPERTLRNVLDSDGTVIIYFGSLSGGTGNTAVHCLKHRRPMLLIDATELTVERAATRAEGFVREHAIGSLNFAGPRASGESRAEGFAFDVATRLIEACRRDSPGRPRIRRAGMADAESWGRLRTRLWPRLDVAAARAEIGELLADADGAAYLLLDGDAAVGFIEARVVAASEPRLHVEGWYVAPEYRGRGHGAALMEQVEQVAVSRAIGLLTSDTDDSYPDSVPAHRGAGFEEIGSVRLLLKRLGRDEAG